MQFLVHFLFALFKRELYTYINISSIFFQVSNNNDFNNLELLNKGVFPKCITHTYLLLRNNKHRNNDLCHFRETSVFGNLTIQRSINLKLNYVNK